MRPYILAETNWKAVRDTRFDVAVLPWGATEAHNYHLPYGTDCFQCDAVAAEAARQAWEAGVRVAVLPTVPFGVNTTQLDIPLTINMNPSTQLAVLADVADSLARQGVPRLVVMNGHGGNDFRQIVRELVPRFPSLFLCTLDWFAFAPWADYFDDMGEHAGELETSVMLAARPDLVRPLAEAGSGATRPWRVGALAARQAWAPRPWTRVTADTGVGDPAAATADKGRRFLDTCAAGIAAFLAELARIPNDNLIASE